MRLYLFENLKLNKILDLIKLYILSLLINYQDLKYFKMS